MKSFFAIFLTAFACYGQKYSISNPPLLPDAKMSPGNAFTNVTVEKICTKGYANVLHGGVRNVPESEKRAVFIEYFGSVPPHPGDFEVDHVVSLEIGGDNSISNLWPQSYLTKPWNSHTKDALENRMAANLRRCLKAQGHDAATALLKQYQEEIETNWIAAYATYIGKPPK